MDSCPQASCGRQSLQKGQQVKHTIAEIHASSIRRLSKVEAADDPCDGADEA
ncbi:MAG: hypothetical protein ABSC47_08645 [Terracidiphilus sp.]